MWEPPSLWRDWGVLREHSGGWHPSGGNQGGRTAGQHGACWPTAQPPTARAGREPVGTLDEPKAPEQGGLGTRRTQWPGQGEGLAG